MIDFEATLARWRQNPAEFCSATWQIFIRSLSPLPFTPARLEVGPDLWGSFWQGDVIAPGYALPALELAYLRAVRFDGTFTDLETQSYLTHLQTTLRQLPAGAWLTRFGSRLALAVAYPAGDWYLIIWLIDGCIVAGYKDGLADSPGYNLSLLLPLPATPPKPFSPGQQSYLPPHRLAEWGQLWPELDQAARLDRLIQTHRAYSHLAGQPGREPLGRWLAQHAA